MRLWRARPDEDLTVCLHCRADYVIPADFDEDGAGWWIRLRCGECGRTRELVVSDATAQRYDADLEIGMRQIAGAVRALEREAMAKDAATLATALQLDLVDANDFVA